MAYSWPYVVLVSFRFSPCRSTFERILQKHELFALRSGCHGGRDRRYGSSICRFMMSLCRRVLAVAKCNPLYMQLKSLKGGAQGGVQALVYVIEILTRLFEYLLATKNRCEGIPSDCEEPHRAIREVDRSSARRKPLRDRRLCGIYMWLIPASLRLGPAVSNGQGASCQCRPKPERL